MQEQIDEAIATLYRDPAIAQFEAINGKDFNPNSTMQLRQLLFDFLGLTPTGKKTGTGANSTDAEVLGELASQSEVPGLILAIRQKSKLKILIWTKSFLSWIVIADYVLDSISILLLLAVSALVVNLICSSFLGITLL